MSEKKDPKFKTACENFRDIEDAFWREAATAGMFGRTSVANCNRSGTRQTLHVLIDDNKGRVAEYWPGSGALWSRRLNTRWTVYDPWQALAAAKLIAAGSSVEAVGRFLGTELFV